MDGQLTFKLNVQTIASENWSGSGYAKDRQFSHDNQIRGPSTLNLARFETIKRTKDADWAGTYHCEVKNLVGGAVSRNVTVSSAYIRKNFLRDPRNGLCPVLLEQMILRHVGTILKDPQ